MNRKTFLMMKGAGVTMLTVALSGLLFSCAQDGFDDSERFDSGVRNTALQSPDVSKITVEVSPDGTTQTIAWPVVYGAGGYEVSVMNVTDSSNPVPVDDVQNDTLDATSVTVAREQDQTYRLYVKTLGNAKYNNTTAEDVTVFDFSSYTETYAEIPSGTDLTAYFAANPVPETADGQVCYDLVAGGQYTVTGALTFGVTTPVMLRCQDTGNKATITFADTDATFVVRGGFSLKNLNIDADASTANFITLDPDYNETGTGGFIHITEDCYIGNCEITNLHSCFIFSNNKKYSLKSLTVDNCIVTLNSTETSATNGAVFYMNKGDGFINSLIIQNSTFSGNGAAKYFVQYGNSGRADRAGYANNLVAYRNSTFYKANKDQWGNYNAMAGRNTSNWEMLNCIFVDCGNGNIARRFLGGRGNQSTATFGYNTYWFNGASETGYESYDNSGTVLTNDPALADPDNGDFTPTGADQLSNRTGDPRWLPATE